MSELILGSSNYYMYQIGEGSHQTRIEIVGQISTAEFWLSRVETVGTTAMEAILPHEAIWTLRGMRRQT